MTKALEALKGVQMMAHCGQLDEFIGEPRLKAVDAAIKEREQLNCRLCGNYSSDRDDQHCFVNAQHCTNGDKFEAAKPVRLYRRAS